MADYTDVDPEHPPHALGTVLRWAVLDRLTGKRRPKPAGPPAPWTPTPKLRVARPTPAQVVWLGHASFLVQLGGVNVLIDPLLGPVLGTYRRYQKPGLTVDQLPPIDVLLITHGHRDHLDLWTVRRLDLTTAVVTPSGLGDFFRRLGFTDVHELDWWRSVGRAGLRFTLAPARHWSRRGLTDLNASLWGSYVIEGDGPTIYHGGDSAYWRGFREIGERFPEIDCALLPIGAYDPAWFMEHAHMNPEQAGQAFLDLGARRFVPMHYGTYRLTDEPLIEPVERLRSWWRREQPQGHLADLPVGGILELDAEATPPRRA
ncbi:MAG: MBL fold metallo-hydrolase [Acidobacteriota bacterium]